MVENYDIQIKEDGSRVVVKNLNDIADASDRAASAVDRLLEKLKQFKDLDVSKVREYADAWGAAGAAMRRAAQDAERLAKATNSIKAPPKAQATATAANYPLATVSNALSTQVSSGAGGGGGLILRQREIFMGMVEEVNKVNNALSTTRGRAFEVKDGFDKLGVSGADAFGGILKLLGTLAAYLTASKIIEYADSWAILAGRVAVTTKTQEEAAYVTERLYEIAVRTRTPIQEMSSLYQNLNIASKNLGNSQKDTLRFTELVGEALAVQKVPAATARGALLQLGQALDSGKVRAQEFNSVNLGVPYIMKIVAENIKGANGNIAALRQQMIAGKLTSKDFFDAFMAGGKTIEADFAKTRQTFAQSFTVLENGLARYFGKLNEAIGASDAFGRATRFIADNMQVIGGVLLSVAAGIAGLIAPAALAGLAGYVRAAGVALLALAGPFGVVLGLIGAAVTAVLLLGNTLQLGTKNGAGFRDLLQALGEEGLKTFSDLWSSAREKLGPIGTMIEKAFKSVNFGDIYMAFAKFFDYIVGGAVTAVTAIIAAFGELPTLIPNILKDLFNKSVTILESLGNKILDQVDAVRVAAGKPVVVRVTTEKMQVDPNYLDNYVNTIVGAAKHAWDISSQQVQNASKALFDRADEIAKRRRQAEVDITGGPKAPPVPFDDKEFKKAENALRSLIQTVAPAYAAQLQLAHAQEVLNNAVAKGVIAQNSQKNGFESATFYMGLVRQHYQDIADPMAKFIRETELQTTMSKLDTRERQVAMAVEKEMQSLKKSGINYSAQELAMRRKILEITIEENLAAEREASRRSSVLEASSERRLRNLKEELDTTAKLRDEKKISGTDAFSTGVSKAGVADLFQGTKDAQDAQLALYRDYYNAIEELRKRDIVSEAAATQAKARLNTMELETKLETTQKILSGVATLMQSGNRKAFEIGKAAAVAQATIEGVVQVQRALASAPPPWNYALAAAAGTAAAVNVSKILSTTPGFESGGYTGNMGRSTVAGVVHGQEFVANAAATARNRPLLEAMNAGATIGTGGMTVYNSITVNVTTEGSVTTETDGNSDLAAALQEGVTAKVMEILIQEKRQGGILSN